MSYSRLTWSIDPKVVGVKDGVGPCYLDDDFYERHPWYKQIFLPDAPDIAHDDWWKPRASMPAYGAPLIHIPMEKNAQHTDFIDFGGFHHGYLVNTRLRDLLEHTNLPRHQYFSASFRQADKEVTGYWWLCYDLETGLEHVDFAKSEFIENSYPSFSAKSITIDTYSEYLQIIRETGQALSAKKLYFNQSFNQDLDIWGTQFLSSTKGYISTRLHKEFERHSITGYSAKNLKCQLFFE